MSRSPITLTYGYNEGGAHRGLTTSVAVSVNSATPNTGTYTAVYDPGGRFPPSRPERIRAD